MDAIRGLCENRYVSHVLKHVQYPQWLGQRYSVVLGWKDFLGFLYCKIFFYNISNTYFRNSFICALSHSAPCFVIISDQQSKSNRVECRMTFTVPQHHWLPPPSTPHSAPHGVRGWRIKTTPPEPADQRSGARVDPESCASFSLSSTA